MRIKNKDIAEALGISTTAVSLALNNKPGVSEETRKKVLKMISDSAAKNAEVQAGGSDRMTVVLSFHKTHGLVMNEKPFFTGLIETIQQEAMKHSCLIAIANYLPGQNLKDYLSYITELNGDGLIVIATEMDESDLEAYKTLDMPLVLTDGYFDCSEVDSIALDNQDAMLRAVRHAYEMGHRDIGYLRSETVIQNFIHHFDGYQKGLRELDLLDRNHPVIDLPCRLEAAKEAMDRFLDHLPSDFVMPSVFIADLDYIALGAMQSLTGHGYRIPEDISMIGYDDINLSAISNPPLTTTHVNQQELGRFAFRRLLELISEGSGDYFLKTEASSTLVVRDSVRRMI